MFGFGAPKRKPISEAWDESVQTSPQSTQSKSQKKPISQAFDEFSKGSKALPYNDFVNRDIQKPQQSETIQLKPEAQTLPPKKPSLGETLKSSFLGFAKSGEEAISRVGTALKYSGKANQVGGERTTFDKVIDPFSIGETKFGRAVKSTVGKVEETVGSKIEGVYGKSAEYYGSRPGYKPELSSFRDESTGKVSLEKLSDPRRLLQVFAEGTASFIPGAVVGAATKNPLAAGAVMGVMEAGDAAQSYAEEIAKNANKSIEDLSDQEVKKVDEMATYYGIASAALESIFPAQLKRIIGEGGKEAEKSLLRRIFVKAPIESLRAIANEGGTEGVQRFAQNVIAKASNINPGQQLSEGVLDEAIAGAITGVGISAATSIVSPGGQAPQEAQNMPVAPVEGEAPQGTPEPPEAPKMPQYEAKKSVKSLFSALESDDTESVQEISSKMSKKELTDARAVLEEMQVDEEASSDPDVLEKVSRDIETVDTLIEQKNASLSQEVKNVVEGNPSTETLHVSDANTVKDIVEQVKGVVDEETKAKIDENLSKVDSKTLPGVAEARALVNENNPFSSIDNLDALEEVYAKKSDELSSKGMSLNKQKSQLLAQKKAVQSREEKKSIQTQIDDLDGERRVVDSDTAILEEQSIAKQLVLVQDTIDRIHAIEPSFNVGKTVDENWEASDYTQYLDGISKKSYEEPRKSAKPRPGRVSRPVELAKGQPEIHAESAGKYAEEAGRNADAVGDQSGERPSDGRDLKADTVVGSKMEQPKKKSAKKTYIAIYDQTDKNGKFWFSGGTRKMTELEAKDKLSKGKIREETFQDTEPKRMVQIVNPDGSIEKMSWGDHLKSKKQSAKPAHSKKEIEKLALSKETFSDEEKAILATYEGAGATRAAGRGILDEFFTPQVVVDKMWSLVTGYVGKSKGLNILEPSAGTGRFISGAPEGSNVEAFETNPVSAKIAKTLNLDAGVENVAFETLFIDEKGKKKSIKPIYNVVIGNPPYGEHRGKYKGLGEEPKIGRYEEYFMKRSLDLTKEGGIVAMVVPSGFLKSPFTYAKREIFKLGELVDAYRLPNKSFKGTDIGTDIVIIKRQGAVSTTNIDLVANDGWFKSNPDKVLGTASQKKGRFGMEDTIEGSLESAVEMIRVDRALAKESVSEEVSENTEKIQEERAVPDPEEKQQKEAAIVQGVEAELRPMKRVVKPEKDHIRRDEKRPYVLTSTKKGGVQVIEQVGASEEERYLYENTLEDGSIDPKADFNKEDANFYKGKYYTEINYASGNIYKKLSALEEDFGDGNMNEKQYERQKKLLGSVLPPKMVIQDISIIPISETAKISLGGVSLVDRFSKWLETLPFAAFEGSNKYQIAGYLNGDPVNVGDKARNREIRKQRRDIGNKLFQKFYKEELPKDFQEKVEERFNKENNSVHTPNYAEYPFSTQLSKTFGGRPLELRPIQMEGASFLVNKGVGILAYEVGVGKTLSAIAAISEVMRRGWAKRPLIVVPKNLRSKWIREIADSIPGVKINDLGNLGADLKFKGDMKEFSIDSNSLSVITEEGFKRIGYSEDTFGKLTRDLQDVTYEKGEKSARASAADDVKAEETVGKARRGTEFPLTFEELGFDHITFDEAHREKNVFAKAQASKEDRKANEYGAVRGAVSERGLKAYLATQYILNENKGRNVFLLTATPFNNSPVEIYSMLSLVAKKRLEDMGIKNINDFISLYIQLETKLAFKADGQYKETDQVRKFQNLQQLQLLVREYIDFRTGEEAGIPRPSKIRKKQFVKMNEMQWNAVKGAQVLFEDKDAGVLKAITELQKITLSPYLSRFSNASMASVSPKVFIENSPKVRYTVEAIKKAHKANPSVGQIVFVEKGVEVFNPMFQHFVKDLKYKSSEVAIMDGSVAEAKRDEIKEKFQNGEIKILMTTIKEGVDLQRNSTDLYNLYLPWNPTDLVQVEGRTWRQGSKYDKVRIHYPLLENSVDVFLFQKLEEKAARLASVFSYRGNDLDVSDIDFEAMKIDLITDPALRAEAEYSLKLTKIENEISRVKSEKSFIEKKAGKIAEINQEISDYTKKVEAYSGYGDSYKDVVASYDRKRTSLKEDLATEISRLRKNGVDMDEIERKMNEKDQEILLASSERENLSKEKEAKISEAKKAPLKEVYGASDFNELTEGMDDAGFFVEMPGAFYNRATRDGSGKFTGSTPVHPDSIPTETIKKYLKSEKARDIVRRIKAETNPAIRSVLQYRVARELASYSGDSKFEALGYFTPQRMEVSMSLAQSEEQFIKVLRHEIRHAAFVLLPREKQILIENWYKKLSETERASLFNENGSTDTRNIKSYEDMSKSGGIFEWDGETPVDPLTFMADEAFNRYMDVRGERTPLQRMMDKMVLAFYRLLSRINAAIFSEKIDRKETDMLYDNVFSQKQGVFDIPAGMMQMLRDKFIIPGRQLSFYQNETVSGGSAFAKNLFGEQTPERQEKRRIYMRAFEKVLAEKRPPSLGKMVDEAFAVKERRTMITAEKLQTLTEAVEDLAMTEGMQAGYLEGETSAVLAREGEIKELQTRLEGVQHVKERADAVKEELNEKSYDRLKALMTLQRKMERQATRYKEQKESLLKRFNEKKLEQKEKAKENVKKSKQNAENKAKELQAIREEMYDYVKEHLPRKHWDKYLRFIRDAKTRENLQKLFESVDEDVKKIQRSAVISKIKKILGKAEDLPIQYQLMIKKITEEIDWGNMLPSTKEKLKKINEYLEKNPEAETSMPVRILRRLKILTKQSYKTLSTEQLLGLSAKLELIQHVGRIAKASNKANLAKGRSDKLALIQKMSTNFDIFKHSGLTREEREKITFWEKSLNALQTTEFQLMPMDYFFYILDGKEEMGTNYQLIKKPIDEAFNGYWKQSTEIKESLSKFIDKLKLESGMEFTDDAWDRIGIHAIRAQKGGTAKLLGSGYDQEAISAVVLNETELAMYGYLRQELDKMFPAIKEVYSRVHNIELEGVDEYFPFLMDWSNRKPVYEELEAQYNNKKGVSGSGFTIKRVGGGNPVRVHALEAFLKHVDQATYFISLEEATRDVQSLISSHRYAEAVGEKAQAYTQRWLEVVERHGVPVDDKQVAFFDALRRNITLGTLAFKLTTIPIQFGAIFSGAAMIGKSAFSGFGDIVSSKEARAFALEASEQIKMRVGDSPEFTEDIPTERKGALGRKAANALNTAREYGMWAIKKADFYTAAGVWLGAYKKKLELSGQEFDMQNVDQDARAYADMVVRMTQGSNEFKDMPPAIAQKYRTFGKLLLQFQNFSLFQWNFARQIVGGNISTDKSKAAWQATMIFANVVFAMQIRALISRGIWGAPPDDDDEESLIASLLWELGQQVPLLGSQLYNLKQFVKNPTYYAAESWQTGVVAIDKTVEAVQAVPKVFVKQKEATREKNIVKAGEAIGNLAGIPGSTQMSQIWRSFLTK